jgi:hypothetical protein
MHGDPVGCATIAQLQDVLAGAQRDRHRLVYVDEAHIHQDADLGYGSAQRGERFFVASRAPGLSAKLSFYGLYLDSEGPVRLWPYSRANDEHTIDVLRRLRAEFPDEALIVLWDGCARSPSPSRPVDRHDPGHPTDPAAGVQP